MGVNSGVNLDIERIAKGDITNQGAVPIYVDHIGENLDARILSKDFKYFPTILSVIISKPPARDYKNNIFKLALIN
jgi:folate-dependent phosphoribosylglycinamide formyltransferase PurN